MEKEKGASMNIFFLAVSSLPPPRRLPASQIMKMKCFFVQKLPKKHSEKLAKNSIQLVVYHSQKKKNKYEKTFFMLFFRSI